MRAAQTSTSPAATIFGVAGRLVNRIREARARRHVVQSLASFDDHMLRDIGLTRFDLDSALVEPMLADPTLVLADRARELRRHQRAMAQDAQAWATTTAGTEGRARAA